MRCPDCEKFVSYQGDEDPEVEDCDVTEDGNVTLTVRATKNCAECGTELKEHTFELEVQCEDAAEHLQDYQGNPVWTVVLELGEGDTLKSHKIDIRAEDEEEAAAEGQRWLGEDKHPKVASVARAPEGTVPDEEEEHKLSVEAEASSTENTEGRPGAPARYRKTMYGVECEVTIRCTCGEEWTETVSDSVSASEFEECV